MSTANGRTAAKRVGYERYGLRKYSVDLDGTWVGTIEHGGGWTAYPAFTASPHRTVEVPDRPSRPSRDEAAVYLLDFIGIPWSIALRLVHGLPLDEEQESWVERFKQRTA